MQRSEREHHEKDVERPLHHRLSRGQADDDAECGSPEHRGKSGSQLRQEPEPLFPLGRLVGGHLHDERCRPEEESCGQREYRCGAAEDEEDTAEGRPDEHPDARDRVAHEVRRGELLRRFHEGGHEGRLRGLIHAGDDRGRDREDVDPEGVPAGTREHQPTTRPPVCQNAEPRGRERPEAEAREEHETDSACAARVVRVHG